MFRSRVATVLLIISAVGFGVSITASCTVSNMAVSNNGVNSLVQEIKDPEISSQQKNVVNNHDEGTGYVNKEQEKIEKSSVQEIKEPNLKIAAVEKENDDPVRSNPQPDAAAIVVKKEIKTDKPKAIEKISDPPVQEPPRRNKLETANTREEETEKDIMEEALLLLDESHKYWVKGEFEESLQMLDQAYALLLDTNGDPNISRQKDDLRLMISKRILAIYNSHQPVAKGKRSEIPLLVNEDVEKEIKKFQTQEKDFFISSYQRSMIFRPVILRELKKAGLPEELSWIPLVESGFKISAMSPARALGLWQFIPSTGYKYGLNRDDWIDERMDVEKSTRAAIDYFKDLHGMFGDWLTVLAGYNCGEGRVMRTISSQHINYLDRFWDLYQHLPYETARYVPRFIATLLIVKDPKKYGMDLEPQASKGGSDIIHYETADVNRCMHLEDIAGKLQISEEQLCILNAELRHKMTPDRAYTLKVPLEKAETLLKVIAEIPEAVKARGSYRAVRRIIIKHRVRRGETLASIAKRYRTSTNAIRSANRLSKGRLSVGQRLNVPIVQNARRSGSGSREKRESGNISRYKVQKGDTLSSVSLRYRISVAEIRKINHLKNDFLRIGQTLLLAAENVEKKEDNRNVSERENDVRSYGVAKKYTIKKGDSLFLIAKKNNISLDKLMKMNKMTRKSTIYPGQVILIQ